MLLLMHFFYFSLVLLNVDTGFRKQKINRGPPVRIPCGPNLVTDITLSLAFILLSYSYLLLSCLHISHPPLFLRANSFFHNIIISPFFLVPDWKAGWHASIHCNGSIFDKFQSAHFSPLPPHSHRRFPSPHLVLHHLPPSHHCVPPAHRIR